jgi:hypothetical protein
MIENIAIIIEDILFVLFLLLCLYGLISCYRHIKTVPGADLLVAGLLFVGISVLFALGASGFGASFFENFSRVGLLTGRSYMYFLGTVPRLGLILVIVGLFRMAKSVKE